ncbi:MAG: 30S ribosomal protein S4, partial [Acidobacteria bacterium]|nr:30S ribosomal protein S4 [Acidobacteriota bacterium]
LLEKQRLRFQYNVSERQLRNYYKRATRMRGVTGDNLVGLLETRLDAVVHRAFAPSVFAARQFVGHGHILVNGRRVNIPSFRVKEGDVVEVREKSRKLRCFNEPRGAASPCPPTWKRTKRGTRPPFAIRPFGTKSRSCAKCHSLSSTTPVSGRKKDGHAAHRPTTQAHLHSRRRSCGRRSPHRHGPGVGRGLQHQRYGHLRRRAAEALPAAHGRRSELRRDLRRQTGPLPGQPDRGGRRRRERLRLPEGGAGGKRRVRLEQRGCLYTPRVIGARVQQDIEIVNDDPTLHNVRALAKANRPFNIGQPARGTRTKSFRAPEKPIKVKCDVHPWMAAFVFVMEHSFHSTTGSDGTYRIDGLPAGSHELVFWHEKLGEQVVEVEVSGNVEGLDLTFEGGE